MDKTEKTVVIVGLQWLVQSFKSTTDESVMFIHSVTSLTTALIDPPARLFNQPTFFHWLFTFSRPSRGDGCLSDSFIKIELNSSNVGVTAIQDANDKTERIFTLAAAASVAL